MLCAHDTSSNEFNTEENSSNKNIPFSVSLVIFLLFVNDYFYSE